MFTAFVVDVFSRRIVGWRTNATMPVALPLDALEMALWARAQADQLVAGLNHHTDAGSQHRDRYNDRLADAGTVASIGAVGDSHDNVLAETTIGLCRLANPSITEAPGARGKPRFRLHAMKCQVAAP